MSTSEQLPNDTSIINNNTNINSNKNNNSASSNSLNRFCCSAALRRSRKNKKKIKQNISNDDDDRVQQNTNSLKFISDNIGDVSKQSFLTLKEIQYYESLILEPNTSGNDTSVKHLEKNLLTSLQPTLINNRRKFVFVSFI